MASAHEPVYPVADAANLLAGLGVSVIPIAARTKEPPFGFKWGEYATRLADASERYTWFVEKGYQIAVVAGPVSQHLTPLDYDGINGFEVHAAQYPVLRTFPRVQTGSGKTHIWLRPTVPTQKYNVLLADGSKLEVRANTHYTVCPPSIHPSGQPYRWIVEPWSGIPIVDLASIGLHQRTIREDTKGEPITEGEPLTDEERATIVRLLTPHYLPDYRHYLVLALAGWLANLEIPETDATIIVKTLARDHQDTGRLIEYERATRDTYKRARAGYAVAGWARLTDTDAPLVAPAVAKQLDLLLRARMPQWTFEPRLAPREVNETPSGDDRTLDDLKRKRFAHLKWVVEGLMPEGAVLLCGRPKSKKSWLALGLAISVSMGGLTLGSVPTQRGTVLYLDLEGNQRRMQSRVAAILGNSPDVPWPSNFYLYTAGEWPSGADAFRALEQWFLDHPDTSFVVIDVLQDFRPPIGPKENAYDYDRNTLKAVNQLAERHHAVIVLIHHTRKAKADDALDEVSGTLGAPSAVATVWVLSRHTDGIHTLLRQRGRDLFNEDDLFLTWDLLAAGFRLDGPAESVMQSDERKAVLDYLNDDQPHTLKDVATALGKSAAATSYLLAALAADGKIEKVKYGTYARTYRQ